MFDNPFADPLAWQPVKAPSAAEMEHIARQVFSRLPEKFRAQCEGLVIRVEEFATDDVLDDLDIDSEFDLLGLFQGVGLPFQSPSAPVQLPNMIWLYRCPILLYWAEHDETLGAVITHVLIHEIGHHFGFSDADMEAIERDAADAAPSSAEPDEEDDEGDHEGDHESDEERDEERDNRRRE